MSDSADPGDEARQRSNRLVIGTPSSVAIVGGVERFARLVAGVAASAGLRPLLSGPSPPRKRAIKTGVQPILDGLSMAKAIDQQGASAAITSGFMGAQTVTPRIHVFHGTMAGHLWASREDLSRQYLGRNILLSGLAERLAARRAVTVAVSESTADELRRFYGLTVDRVIPNGVDTTIFSPAVSRDAARDALGLSSTERYALFVGRNEHRKGGDLLRPACEAAGARLLTAGDAHLGDDIVNLGALDTASLALAYRAADCVLFPTRYEACSYVVLEALASGTPLVTTDCGYMRDILNAVPEYSPFIVKPELESVTRGLRNALTRPADDQAALAARRFVERNASLETFTRAWASVIESRLGA